MNLPLDVWVMAQLQGALLALAGLAMAWRHPGRAWLSALLLVLALSLLTPLLHRTGAEAMAQRLAPLALLLGPLLLGLIESRSGEWTWLRWPWRGLHFLAPLSGLLVASWLPERVIAWEPLLAWVFLAYGLLAWTTIARHERRLREHLAETEALSLARLQPLLLAGIGLSALLGIAHAADAVATDNLGVIQIGLALLIAAFALLAVMPIEVPLSTAAVCTAPAVVEDESTSDSEPPPSPARRLDDDALAQLLTRLDRLGEQPELLFDHDLDLVRLAKAMRVRPHQLSWALNHARGTRFYEFINDLRAEAAQRRLRDPAFAASAILDIAFACGFATKTTFNRAFKARTGMTPSAWRQSE